MNVAVSRILRRILPLALLSVGADVSLASTEHQPSEGSSPKNEEKISSFKQTTKLIFGRAREGKLQLAAHSSHSSHRSHSSHYSGTGGSYTPPAPKPSQPSYNTPPATPPPSTPDPTPAPTPPTPRSSNPLTTRPPDGQPSQPEGAQPGNEVIAAVLKKLPMVRSHWPEKVKLTKATRFQLYEGDRIVGMFELSPGATVTVFEIKHQHLIAKLAVGNSPIPVLNTDTISVMGGAEKILALPDDPAP